MIRRGEVWWADLPEPTGSEPGSKRPVAIVQADSFNDSGLATFMGVALTSNLRLAAMPGNFVIDQTVTGLATDCVANITQLFTADRRVLSTYICDLPDRLIRRLDAGLRLVLDL